MVGNPLSESSRISPRPQHADRKYPPYASGGSVEVGERTYHDAFGLLLNNPRHSDIAISISGSNILFSAHMSFLSLRTSYFSDMLDGGKYCVQNERKVFTVSEASAHTVWRFLTYCYTGTYSNGLDSQKTTDLDDSEYVKHMKVYAFAEVLNSEELKNVAFKKFGYALSSLWNRGHFLDLLVAFYSTSSHSVGNGRFHSLIINQAFQRRAELSRSDTFLSLLDKPSFLEFSSNFLKKILLANTNGFNQPRFGSSSGPYGTSFGALDFGGHCVRSEV